MIAQGARIAEEYYFSLLLDRANRTYLAMCSKEGGMEIEQLAVERPEALARIAVDPNIGIDEAKAQRDRRRRRLRRRPTRPRSPRPAEAVDRLPRRGRHARRGQPAGQDRGRRHRRPRRQGDARRERRLPPRRTTRRSRTRPPRTRSRPRAKEKDLNYVKLDGSVGIIGNGAGPGHEHARRRRVRR